MQRRNPWSAGGRRALAPAQQLGTVALRRWLPPGRRLPPGPEQTAATSPGNQECRRDRELARVEAVLLLARTPLTSRKLAQMAGLPDGTRARTLVRRLQQCYQAQGTAFQVVEVAGGFQLRTRPELAPWTTPLYQDQTPWRLSAPALETLAVVAYRQPVLRAQVEAIRGVQSGELLKQLLQRGLVRIVGRSPELGRPFLYGTTRRFLEVFGLRSLDDLPQFDIIRQTQPSDWEQQSTLDQPQESSEVRTTLLSPDRSAGSDLSQQSAAQPHPFQSPRPVAPHAQENGEDWDEDEEWDEDDEDWDEDDEDWDEELDEDWEEVDDEEWDEDDEDWDEDWEDEDWEDEEEDYLDLE